MIRRFEWPFLVVIGAIFLYTLGLAVGPRVSGAALDALSTTGARLNCLTAIDLPGPFGILLNCDSPEFMEAASHPSRLLDKNNVRQSRPGQIWLAWLLSRPLTLFASTLGSLGQRGDVGLPEGTTRSKAQAIADLAPGFIAYYAINVAILIVSVLLLHSAANVPKASHAVVTLTASVLVFNDVTKAYLITPHSQLLNILVPVFLVWLLYRLLEGRQFSIRSLLLLSGVAGLGVLVYQTWFLVLPAIVIGSVFGRSEGRDQRLIDGRTLLRWLPLMVCAMVVPWLLWYGFVVAKVGAFYQHEIAHDGGLVWMTDRGIAAAVARLGGNVAYLVGQAGIQAIPYAVFLVPPVALLVTKQVTLTNEDRRKLITASCSAAVVMMMFLAFFALLGFRQWRYAVPMMPPWSLPLALLQALVFQKLPIVRQLPYKLTLLLIAMVIGVIYVAKEGPWG